VESRIGAVNISTAPLASTFTRGGLRCNRVNFDLDGGATHEVIWIVGGPLGCITFSLLEIHPIVPELSALTTQYINGKQYMGLDLGSHIIVSHPADYEPHYQGPCLFLDGLPCRYSGSGMNAMYLLKGAVEADNEDIIWDVMIERYHSWIEEDDAEEMESPLEGPFGSIDQ
jgi:hypothetical protein